MHPGTIGAALAATMLLATPASAGTVRLLADEWCPYNCAPDAEKPGFMVEIAREALGLAGHDVVYEAVGWRRALHLVEAGEADGVIGAVPDEAVGFVYGPALGTYSDSAAVRRGEAFDLDAPEALQGRVLGLIGGYDYEGAVAAYAERHGDDDRLVQYATGEAPLEQNMRKLDAGRLDVVADVEAVLSHAVARLGLSERIEVLGGARREYVYIAFSPALATSPGYARDLAAGLEQMRESGRLGEIMRSYGLAVWD